MLARHRAAHELQGARLWIGVSNARATQRPSRSCITFRALGERSKEGRRAREILYPLKWHQATLWTATAVWLLQGVATAGILLGLTGSPSTTRFIPNS